MMDDKLKPYKNVKITSVGPNHQLAEVFYDPVKLCLHVPDALQDEAVELMESQNQGEKDEDILIQMPLPELPDEFDVTEGENWRIGRDTKIYFRGHDISHLFQSFKVKWILVKRERDTGAAIIEARLVGRVRFETIESTAVEYR